MDIGRFAKALYLGSEFDAKIEARRKEHPPAYRLGVKECVNCGMCCWRGPCSLTKEDVGRLATHLGLTAAGLFKNYLIVSTRGGFLVLGLIRKGQEFLAGGFLPWVNTYDVDAPCYFRDDVAKRCTVHEAKPIDGQEQFCWDEDEENTHGLAWSREDLMALGWDGRQED